MRRWTGAGRAPGRRAGAATSSRPCDRDGPRPRAGASPRSRRTTRRRSRGRRRGSPASSACTMQQRVERGDLGQRPVQLGGRQRRELRHPAVGQEALEAEARRRRGVRRASRAMPGTAPPQKPTSTWHSSRRGARASRPARRRSTVGGIEFSGMSTMRGDAAGRGRAGGGREPLPLGAAGLVDVHVGVDQAGQQHLVVGRGRPARGRRATCPAGWTPAMRPSATATTAGAQAALDQHGPGDREVGGHDVTTPSQREVVEERRRGPGQRPDLVGAAPRRSARRGRRKPASALAVAGSSRTAAGRAAEVVAQPAGRRVEPGAEEQEGGQVAGRQLGRVQVPALVEPALERAADEPEVQRPSRRAPARSSRPAGRWSSRRQTGTPVPAAASASRCLAWSATGWSIAWCPAAIPSAAV